MFIIPNVYPINKIMLVDLSPYTYFEIVQTMLFFFTSTVTQTMSKDSAYVICFLYCKIQQPKLNLVLI